MTDVEGPRTHSCSGDALLVLCDEAGAMLEYALERGMTVTTVLVAQVAGVDPTASPADRDGMVAAHVELAKLIRPATPDGVATLRRERKANLLRYLGPVGLVRFLMGLTIFALLFFLGFIVVSEVPQELNTLADGANVIDVADSKGEQAIIVGYLLSAAVLGATFGQLYRVKRYISDGTYDRRLDSTYLTNVVLGAVAGIVLATLVPLSNGAVTKPLLALLGGFSARAVHRILSRLVDSVETLVRGDPRDEVAAAAQAQASQAATETSQKIIADMTGGVAVAAQAIADGQPEVAQAQLATIQTNLSPVVTPIVVTPTEGTPPTTNAIPTDGADDATAAAGLEKDDPGAPWSDPDAPGFDLIPGLDFDPDDDPEQEPDDDEEDV